MSTDDFGHNQRARALALSEGELRRRVDVLLEQCSREHENQVPLPYRAPPVGPYLYVSEILFLLGVGEGAGYTMLKDLLTRGEGLIETDGGDLSQAEFEARDRAAYDADPEGWIRDHTVGGIRPHIPRRSGDDVVKFGDAFPGYCSDGTCGVCGACTLRRDGG
jgi:hypothetical protein